MTQTTKWEYKVVPLTTKRNFVSGQFDADALENELNKFGLEGWELVRMDGLIIANAAPPLLTFKRLL